MSQVSNIASPHPPQPDSVLVLHDHLAIWQSTPGVSFIVNGRTSIWRWAASIGATSTQDLT